MAIEQTTSIPEVQETIVKVRELSGDEKARALAFYREMMLRDEASALSNAERKGEVKGDKKKADKSYYGIYKIR